VIRTDADAIHLVLVDFDDTLVATAPRFQSARRELFRLLVGQGFGEQEIQRVHHDVVDPPMRLRHGLGPSRLEHSFRATYEALCAATAAPPEPGLADRLAELGRAVAGTPPCIDGAIDALRLLADALPTALYTQAGDATYQTRCVREAGVLDVIPAERVRIVPRKTTRAFAETLRHFGVRQPHTAWMVGNSMRSDVNPALEAGARAIFVEVDDPWEFDVVDPVAPDFVHVRSFADAVAFLLAETGARPQPDPRETSTCK
jgi:putative hydrolase of the HAD superfamily